MVNRVVITENQIISSIVMSEPSQISLNNALSPIIEEFLYFNDYAITMLLMIWFSVITTLFTISTTKLYDIAPNDANHLEFI